jgi:CheY-like chemotaxis protein
MTNKVIWLIDDDQIYHIIMKKIIDRLGVSSKVISFNNGQDAIQALEKTIENSGQFPDLILLDIEMPVLDGWEFMNQWQLLKERLSQKIQIYISSSSIAIEDKQKAKTIQIF